MKKSLLAVPAVGALLFMGGGVASAATADEALTEVEVLDPIIEKPIHDDNGGGNDGDKVKKVHTDNGGGNDPDPCELIKCAVELVP